MTLLGPLMRGVGWCFTFWLRTLRFRVHWPDGTTARLADVDDWGNSLYSFSERDVMTILAAALGRTVITLVDDSPDGEWAAAAAAAAGCQCIRGSSLHGGFGALRKLIGALQASDHPAAIAVDGPVGPAGQAKQGIAVCAATTGRSIVPVAAAASWRIDFPRSWAGHYLPLPWSRVALVVGEPLSVRREASREEIDAVARVITGRLRELRERALLELDANKMPVEPTAA